LGQPGIAHRPRRVVMIVVQWLDARLALIQNGKTRCRVTIIGRHANHPGIDPEDVGNATNEVHPAMPCDHGIDRPGRRRDRGNLVVEVRGRTHGPKESGDICRAPMDDGETACALPEYDHVRQIPHPMPVRRVNRGVRMGKPPGRKQIACASFRESTAAIRRTRGELPFTITGNHRDAQITQARHAGRRLRAIGDHITGTDAARGRNAAPVGFGHRGVKRWQIGIRSAKKHHMPLNRAQIHYLHRRPLDCARS